MTEVWIEHPDRSESRKKVTHDALTSRYVLSGWRESPDQSDPEPDPAPVDDPESAPATDSGAADESDTPKRKGRS